MTRVSHVMAFALLFALAGCGDQTPTPAAPPATSTHTDVQREYLDTLRRVNPALVVKEDFAIRHGEATCQMIEERFTRTEIVKMAAERFTNEGHQVDHAEATEIVRVVLYTLCRHSDSSTATPVGP